MSCFVLSDDYGCTEALWLWKWLYTMSCLVQEPEENVNIINNYIQITHKSTYLKTYLKKEIWSKKNGSFSSTQAPHQQAKINSLEKRLSLQVLESIWKPQPRFCKHDHLRSITYFSYAILVCSTSVLIQIIFRWSPKAELNFPNFVWYGHRGVGVRLVRASVSCMRMVFCSTSISNE